MAKSKDDFPCPKCGLTCTKQDERCPFCGARLQPLIPVASIPVDSMPSEAEDTEDTSIVETSGDAG